MGFKTLPPQLSDSVLTVANVAALSDVTDPQEGDERYVADIDVLYMYTGIAWAPAAASSGSPLAPSRGGTGVSNNDAATLTRTGNHALTITTTGTTGVTLPTSGTLGAVPAAGVVTSSGSALTSEASLALTRGGTGKSITASAGAVVYSDADSLELNTPGTAGQVLISAGSGTPAFTSSLTALTQVTATNDALVELANNAPAWDGSGLSITPAEVTGGWSAISVNATESTDTVYAVSLYGGATNSESSVMLTVTADKGMAINATSGSAEQPTATINHSGTKSVIAVNNNNAANTSTLLEISSLNAAARSISTPDSPGADGTATQSLRLGTGHKSAGTGDTGNLVFTTGNSTGGGSGSITFQTGTGAGGDRGAITFDGISASFSVPALHLDYPQGAVRLNDVDESHYVDLCAADDLTANRKFKFPDIVDATVIVSQGAQSINGVKTFNDGIVVDDAAGQTTLNYFRYETHDTDWDMPATAGKSGVKTLHLQRIGNWVTCYIPSFACTPTSGTNNNCTNDTVLPSYYRPTVSQRIAGTAGLDNSATDTANTPEWLIGTSGVITFRRNQAGSAFSNTGTAGTGSATTLTWFVG